MINKKKPRSLKGSIVAFILDDFKFSMAISVIVIATLFSIIFLQASATENNSYDDKNTSSSINVAETTYITTTTVEVAAATTKEDTTTSTTVTTTTTTSNSTTVSTSTEQQETTVEAVCTTTTEEFLAYNPSSNRVHRSSCEYYDDSMERLYTDELEDVIACPVCDPDITISYSTTTTIVEETKEVVTTTTTTSYDSSSSSSDGSFVKTFSRGTYYTGSVGGSGRTLQNGYSIASRYLYEMYGYTNSSGQPHLFRIECPQIPELNGIYQLDDCSAAGNYEVVDIFYSSYSYVPSAFKTTGVVTVNVYLIQ